MRFNFENPAKSSENNESSISLIPISLIRVSDKQNKKVSKDKVERHRIALESGQEDLMPLDGCKLADGTYIIDGNGRHRYFGYLAAGYTSVPINDSNHPNFRPN